MSTNINKKEDSPDGRIFRWGLSPYYTLNIGAKNTIV